MIRRCVALNLVLLPENLPIEETARALEDLGKFGIKVPALIINEVIPKDTLKGNWFLERRRATQDKYLTEIEQRFKGLIMNEVPLFETDIYGLDRLRMVGEVLYGK
jgi:arsenite-transporting ATPase